MNKLIKNQEKNVHTEHCCVLHGCKYGDDNCPIWLGWQKQSYCCESCWGCYDETNIPTGIDIPKVSKEEIQLRRDEYEETFIGFDSKVEETLIKSKTEPKIFVTSDSHFGHFNILKYCNRPFSSVEEMNETLIKNWNDNVSKNDTVIHLGDFAFRQSENLSKVFNRLNGNIHLLLGNHDNRKSVEEVGFASIKEGLWDYSFMDNGIKKKVFLCHYPMLSWNARFHGRCHLHGHIHSGPRTFPKKIKIKRSYDIGVDNNDFCPVELTKIIAKLEMEEVDNHE